MVPLSRLALITLLALSASPAWAERLNTSGGAGGVGIARAVDVDPAALAGTSHFGVYFDGHTALGSMTVTVTPGDHGGWVVDTTVGMEVGPASFGMTEHAELDADFATLSIENTDVEITGGEETSRNVDTLRLAGKKWKYTRSGTQGDVKASLAAEGPNHGELTNLFPMVRALALTPATYDLRGVFHEREGGETRLYHAPVTVVVEPRMPFEFRGRMVDAHLVRVDQDGELTVLAVAPDHRILALWPESEDVPIRMIAGTLDECSRDIPTAASMDPDVIAARAVVEQLVMVMAAQADPATLDDIFDWAALHEKVSAEDAVGAGQTVEEVATAMKADMVREAELTEAEAAIFCKLLDVQVTGDQARVFIPGFEEASFLLHKRDGRWLLYWMED